MKPLSTLLLAASLALAAPLTAPAQEAPDHAIHLGPLVLTDGFARATLPNAPVAGGFLTIENTGTEDDTLTGGSAPFAGEVQVHEMKMDGEVMKMRQLDGGLPIPAGGTVTLKPGSFHLMFMDLQRPLTEGEIVTVTLTFAKAGSVEVPLAVGAPNARAPMAMQGHMHAGPGKDN